MKTIFIKIFPTILFTVLMTIYAWKQSGGDIFVQIMIVSFVILQIIIYAIARLFIQFDLLKNLLYLIISGVVSYIFFLVCLQLS
jgi:hypothetical protein